MSIKILHIDSNNPLLWNQLEQAGFVNHTDFTSSKEWVQHIALIFYWPGKVSQLKFLFSMAVTSSGYLFNNVLAAR